MFGQWWVPPGAADPLEVEVVVVAVEDDVAEVALVVTAGVLVVLVLALVPGAAAAPAMPAAAPPAASTPAIRPALMMVDDMGLLRDVWGGGDACHAPAGR